VKMQGEDGDSLRFFDIGGAEDILYI